MRFITAALTAAAAAAIAACATSGTAGNSTAGAGPDAGDGTVGAGSDSAAVVDFCAGHPDAILCDDFESNGGGISNVWNQETSAESSRIYFANSPTGAGHVAQFTVTADRAMARIVATIKPGYVAQSMSFEFDVLVDALTYDSMDRGWLHVSGAERAFFGVSKGGDIIGKVFAPHSASRRSPGAHLSRASCTQRPHASTGEHFQPCSMAATILYRARRSCRSSPSAIGRPTCASGWT